MPMNPLRAPSPFHLLIFLLISSLVHGQDDNVQQIDMKTKIQQQETNIRDGVGLFYGKNTEMLTFNVTHMVDFIVKTVDNEQARGNVYVYWKEDNVYIGSEYREGQGIRLLIYEDNYRIIQDSKFYTTYGFKFTAQKGKTYTIRFVGSGNIQKIIAMEISKTLAHIENTASKDHLQLYSQRMEVLAGQIGVLSGVSEFTVLMHEKSARSMNHGICIYMTYLMIQAAIIFIVVALQVRVLTKMLGESSIV